MYDPSVASSATAAGAGELFTLQPAQMLGTPPGTTGTFLVSYDGASNGAGDVLDVIRVDNPTGLQLPAGGCWKHRCGGAYSSFSAPQPGTTTTIAAGDDRTLSVVWRNGYLYAMTTVIPPYGADAGNTTAHCRSGVRVRVCQQWRLKCWVRVLVDQRAAQAVARRHER